MLYVAVAVDYWKWTPRAELAHKVRKDKEAKAMRAYLAAMQKGSK